MDRYHNLPDHYKYGLIVFACVFFVGWSTGMGGALLPNIGFSAIMGVLAMVLFRLIKSKFGPQDKE